MRSGAPAITVAFTACFLGLGLNGSPALGGQEPGWYVIVLEGGESLTARLVEEEGDYYVVNFQGNVIRISRAGVKRLQRVSKAQGLEPAHGGAAAPAAQPEGEGPDSGKEEALRDAIESLASADRAVVDRSYKLLGEELAPARPLLHLALTHRAYRVRVMAVKLLGEKGTSAEDSKAITARLGDDHQAVRLAAVMALRALGPDGLPAIIDYLETESVPNNRKMAVKNLHHWNDQRAVAPLVDRLNREEHEGVRGFIFTALEALTRKKLGHDVVAWTAYLCDRQDRRELERLSGSALPGGGAGDGPAREPRGAKE